MNGRKELAAESRGGLRRLAAAASVLAVLALGTSAGAQDEGGAPPQRTDTEEPAPPPQPASERDSPRSARDAADDVFVPTEEIAADEEVVFPVDI